MDARFRPFRLCALRKGRAAAIVLLGAFLCSTALPAQQDEKPANAPPPERSKASTPEDRAKRLLEFHSSIAWRTLSRGNLKRAEAMFRDILRRDPDRPDDIAGLSAALARQEKLDDAIKVLSDGTARFPDNAKLASALGQAYLNSKDNRSAMKWLQRAYWLKPDAPNSRYFLGSSYLNCGYPLLALRTMCGAETSTRELGWAQDLGIGIAFSQLNLQCEASGYFTSVSNAAEGTPLADNASRLLDDMDKALLSREYFRGSLRYSRRYDDNPGVIPSSSATGASLTSVPSAGNFYQGEFSYDLIREYNYDLATGYSFLHTSNDKVHRFDVIDNGIFLAANRRAFWRDMPVNAGLRFDYDHLLVGSDDFLQRFVATPSLTFTETDEDATTVMFRYSKGDFLRQGLFNNTSFDLDYDNLLFGVQHERQLFCRAMSIFGGYEYDLNISQGANYDYGGHKLRVGLNWKLPLNDLRLNVLGEYYFRDYDNRHSLLGQFRRDDQYLVQVALVYPVNERWNLWLEWNYDRNDSNLVINDYTRHVAALGPEYRFPK
ncbi:MAG: tetratricopeptide repeat protein [Planctomycetaceae bacterium]